METKPWWTSKVLWTNAVMMIAAITGAMGLDVGLDPETQIAIVGGVLALANILLRFVTTTAVATS